MNKIRQELFNLRDEKYKEFNKKLCPDTNKEMLGIKVPVIRNFAKKILKENSNLDEILMQIENEYFEEVILKGLIIAYSKLKFEEKIKYIKGFIPLIDSWAISDTFIPTLKIKENELECVWEFILLYIDADQEFDVRFAVIMMLDYFIIDEYVDRVIEELNNVKHDGYYVKMGVAWCLAEIGIKYNNKLMLYMNSENNLDKFTYNKTLQKMIESRRISDTQKIELRKMKKK